MTSIDLNSDMGEGFGRWSLGDDDALLEHVSSTNVACGFHAGDPRTMATLVRHAKARGVSIGAHPGLPDLQGFGRREMRISPAEAYDMTVYQIGALKGFTDAAGVRLAHVKAHGALYNMAAKDGKLAEALARAVRDVDASLVFFVLSGSVMVDCARQAGLKIACEVFGDRSYQDDGSLTPRSQPGAMITDLQASIDQVLRMVREGRVRAQSGKDVALEVDTLCLHGDQPGAVAFAREVRRALEREGVTIAPAKGRA
ncbi:MAG: LamB/YcsF family protein [Lautropia sp.]